MSKGVLNLFSTIGIMAVFCGNAAAASAPNPRATTPQTMRDDTSAIVSRGGTNAPTAQSHGATVSRSATNNNVVTRRLDINPARQATQNTTRTRAAVVNSQRSDNTTTRSAGASRAATLAGTSRAAASNIVRSASSLLGGGRGNGTYSGMARSARATAVFNDISKIGGGYAACRESYATCMDQLCANANDTYRRCFCSDRFQEFRDMEDAISAATDMLAQFENNNLEAVNMTAAEVNAMYTATAGENAIKKDTSAASKMLDEVGELLSGRKKPTEKKSNATAITVNGLLDTGDIWATNDNASSIFGGGRSSQNLAEMEGKALYNAANNQCLELVDSTCSNDAVLSMARSAYSIMITQDCNAYEKTINTKKETLNQTVRMAEKYLREARLEEYRSHNSADVNECMDKVKNAMMSEAACGPDYVRCLDYSGIYIDTNGDPRYSERLFELNKQIVLDGSADVLAQNRAFNDFLESKRMYATTALDSCRDISATVWQEFKRNALIEIAQAQDEKLEEVKMNCVNTMKECYDKQTNSLKNFATTAAVETGALSVALARDLCVDKVNACAALYSSTNCQFDPSSGKLQTDTGCGLQALLDFVGTVDDTRIAQSCADAIDKYLTDLCTPTSGTQGYPWNCRTKSPGTMNDSTKANSGISGTLAANIIWFATQNCPKEEGKTGDTFADFDIRTRQQITDAFDALTEQIENQMNSYCVQLEGNWISKQFITTDNGDQKERLIAFYSNTFGGDTTKGAEFGICQQNTTRLQCLANNTDSEKMASYNAAQDECTLTDNWYERQCALIGGYYEGGICYANPN